MLRVKNLKITFSAFGKSLTAVNDISFEVNPGETLCLVGESGCGKSVTSLALLRLIDPPGKIESGEIRLGEQDLLSLSESQMRQVRGQRISMIFQDPLVSLNPSYTLGFQLEEVLKLHQKHLTKQERQERLVEILTEVAIPSPLARLKEYPFRLSGGTRQRAMIAMAMACQPEVLIADEPTTALDVTIQAQILSLMNQLKQKENTALLFITHDLGVVAEMADRVAVMYTGKIVEQASVQELFQNPKHPYTQGLLQARPSLQSARKSRLYSIPDKVPSLNQLPAGCTFWPRCPIMDSRCQSEVPSLQPLTPNHQVACFKA